MPQERRKRKAKRKVPLKPQQMLSHELEVSLQWDTITLQLMKIVFRSVTQMLMTIINLSNIFEINCVAYSISSVAETRDSKALCFF